jgi:hypothetical protein
MGPRRPWTPAATTRRSSSACSAAPRGTNCSRPGTGWGDLHHEIAAVARGSFRRREPPEIRGSGYVVESLEAALWALSRTDSFRDGALAAVNLGDDADTTGAVYGQLAGALYGEDGIPAEWRTKLALRETIERSAERLHELAADR